MLPEFPQFKHIELSDKEDVEAITGEYPPYSDFNFVSMWSWDIRGEMRLSVLYGNLVVRFTDYLTGQPFYSFIGENKVNETAKALLQLSKKEKLKPMLKLVPEFTVKLLDSKFNVAEDRDNFDYLYTVANLATLKGNSFQTQRNLINQFLKTHEGWSIKVVNFNEISQKNSILTLFSRWIINRKNVTAHRGNVVSFFTKWIKVKPNALMQQEYENEFLSLNKLLTISNSSKFNLMCFEIYVKNALIGFVINESVGEYNIIHFEKADTSFKGSYQLLMQENSKMLHDNNIRYLNFEQDLGVESLRFAKTKFKPSSFLKKYTVK